MDVFEARVPLEVVESSSPSSKGLECLRLNRPIFATVGNSGFIDCDPLDFFEARFVAKNFWSQ